MTEEQKPISNLELPLDRKIKVGYYAKRIGGSWAVELEKALMDESLLSLTQDVALLRVLLARFVDQLGDRAPSTDELDSVIRGTEAIGRAAERIAGKQGVLTKKGSAAFVELIMRVVLEEVGQEHPKAALRITDRLRKMGPKDLPAGSMQKVS